MRNKILTFLLFSILMAVGVHLALQKPLWTDEINTQVLTVDKLSYQDIILLKYFPESNRSPLYYLIQKGVSDAFGYQYPVEWDRRWNFSDVRSQIIVRLSSILFMSLGLALIFYFFAKYYSLRLAFFSLAVSCVSPMIWEHGVEARPYAMWFLLSVIQSMIFLNILRENKFSSQNGRNLTIVHFVLSFTIIFSVIQIVLISFFVWLYQDRKLKGYVFLTGIPAAISAFYFLASKHMFRWTANVETIYAPKTLQESVSTLVQEFGQPWYSFPLEFLVFFVVFAGVFWMSRQRRADLEARKLFFWITSFLGMAFLFFVYYTFTTSMRQKIPTRYFMFLVPVCIMGITLVYDKMKIWCAQDKWLIVNLYVFCGGIFLLRGVKTFVHFLLMGLY